jgi:hypothetical protein
MTALARTVAFPRHVLCSDADLSASCSTAVDIAPGRSTVLLRLACLTAFTVAVDPETVDALVVALRTGDIRAVLAQHDQRGRVLLGVRPHLLPGRPGSAAGEGPMEVELHLAPHRRIRLVFTRPQADELADHLTDARALLAPSRPHPRP